ncbi:hypothetical protein [Gemmatimonas phototrophica]|uniref:DUF3108 domain-containing protein n=1 Tax=Gemmatimonas phototrophica TaxID=1379270 RepID=A0A143BNC7_9BACT|nr:hypothetical protein [Gemmatimonas phototrophica]AMW06085.1 hypothetical protein GEMMAAP_17430 [Gemmatimonas phototrophica]
MIRTVLWAVVFATGLGSTAHAQATALSTQVDPARLKVGVDSFAVLMRGTPMGWQTLARTRDSQTMGWELRDAIALGGMVNQESILSFTATLAERTLRQSGVMRGAPMRIALDFVPAADGVRIIGQSATPTSAGGVLAIDTVVPVGTVDDNAVTPLLAAVRWREGLDLRVPVLTSGKGTVAEYRLRVLRADTVTVPAGHFDVWRIEQQAERSMVTLFVTRTAPYRLVRMQESGMSLDIVLVSTRNTPR